MRATQYIAYLNQHPTADEGASLYTHLTFTDGLKAARRKFRRLSANISPTPCFEAHEGGNAQVALLKHPVRI